MNLLIYSGIPENEWARGGVACSVHKDEEANITGWKFINDLIMTVDWVEEENNVMDPTKMKIKRTRVSS